MTPSEQEPLSIFLWHHPADTTAAVALAEDMLSRGYDVSYKAESVDQLGDPSFITADWQMTKSNCIIFLLSHSAVRVAQLQTNAEKAMRRDNTLVIPILLDNLARKDIPLLLRYIKPITLYKDNKEAIDSLSKEIERKRQGKPSLLTRATSIRERPIRWMIEHFRRYLILPPLTFCWQITVENLIVSLTVTGFIYLVWQPTPRSNLQNITATTFIWLVILTVPVVETVVFQMIPVSIARLLNLGYWGQMLFSVAPFAVLHFTRSIGAGIGAGIIGGFYSAFTFVHWRTKSQWTAFWVTALSHGLYNMALFTMLIGEY